eukprot:TRINITY_DN7027_c0_g1_i1.p1 TRINITY_DN7027_c0_g1~~TRINITY_DN7027_c0_g1_i1.p1  ORF type:complete len:1804 (+),score=473.88 TRINITY_DN7027_c0_g1_i1:78-5414(+)
MSAQQTQQRAPPTQGGGQPPAAPETSPPAQLPPLVPSTQPGQPGRRPGGDGLHSPATEPAAAAQQTRAGDPTPLAVPPPAAPLPAAPAPATPPALKRLCEVRVHGDGFSREDLLVETALFNSVSRQPLFTSPFDAPVQGAKGGKGGMRGGPRSRGRPVGPDSRGGGGGGKGRPAPLAETHRAAVQGQPWVTGWHYYFLVQPAKIQPNSEASPTFPPAAAEDQGAEAAVVRGCTVPTQHSLGKPASIHERLAQHLKLPINQSGVQVYLQPLPRDDWKDYELSHVELTFIDAFVSRSDLWALTHALKFTTVYLEKQLTTAFFPPDTVVRAVLSGDTQLQARRSGIVTPRTKLTFRSKSARLIWMFQLSAEMFLYSDDGDMYYQRAVDLLVRDVVRKWRGAKCKHGVLVVLFARLLPAPGSLCGVGGDYIRVVCDVDGTTDDGQWDGVPKLLRCAVWRMVNELRVETPLLSPERWYCGRCLQCQRRSRPAGQESPPVHPVEGVVDCGPRSVLSSAQMGNAIQVINLAMNALDRHHIDRSLLRTGQAIVLVSAGTGVFRTQWSEARVTRQRMLDLGTSCTLICLGRPPLHVAPCLEYDQSTDPMLFSQRNDAPPNYYERAEWMNIRFYCRQRRSVESQYPGSIECDLMTFDAAISMYMQRSGLFLPHARMISARRAREQKVFNGVPHCIPRRCGFSEYTLSPKDRAAAVPPSMVQQRTRGRPLVPDADRVESDDRKALGVPAAVVRWVPQKEEETASPVRSGAAHPSGLQTPSGEWDSPPQPGRVLGLSPKAVHQRTLSGEAARRLNSSRNTKGGAMSPCLSASVMSPMMRSADGHGRSPTRGHMIAIDDIRDTGGLAPSAGALGKPSFVLPFELPGPNIADVWGGPIRDTELVPPQQQRGRNARGPPPRERDMVPYEAANSKRWAHIFPSEHAPQCQWAPGESGKMWKFMVEPALLPLTTPYFPYFPAGMDIDVKVVPAGYEVHHSSAGFVSDQGCVPCRRGRSGMPAFFHECIMQRLHRGYQWHVPDDGPQFGTETPERISICQMSIGHQFHRIVLANSQLGGMAEYKLLQLVHGASAALCASREAAVNPVTTGRLRSCTLAAAGDDIGSLGMQGISPLPRLDLGPSGAGTVRSAPRSWAQDRATLPSSFSGCRQGGTGDHASEASVHATAAADAIEFCYKLYNPFTHDWDDRQAWFQTESGSRFVNWSGLDNLLGGTEDLVPDLAQSGSDWNELINRQYRARKVRFAIVPPRPQQGGELPQAEAQHFRSTEPVQRLLDQICGEVGEFVVYAHSKINKKVKVAHLTDPLSFHFPREGWAGEDDHCQESSYREQVLRELVLESKHARDEFPQNEDEWPTGEEQCALDPRYRELLAEERESLRPLHATPPIDRSPQRRTPWLAFGVPLTAHPRCYFTFSITWLACPFGKVQAFRDFLKRRVDGVMGSGYRVVQVPWPLCKPFTPSDVLQQHASSNNNEGVWSPLRPFVWLELSDWAALECVTRHLVLYKGYLPPFHRVSLGAALLHVSGNAIVRIPSAETDQAVLCFINNPCVSWPVGCEDGPDQLRLGVAGAYEALDERGKWWPATVVAQDTRRNRYIIDIEDGFQTQWRNVPLSHIRLRQEECTQGHSMRQEREEDTEIRPVRDYTEHYQAFRAVADSVEILFSMIDTAVKQGKRDDTDGGSVADTREEPVGSLLTDAIQQRQQQQAADGGVAERPPLLAAAVSPLPVPPALLPVNPMRPGAAAGSARGPDPVSGSGLPRSDTLPLTDAPSGAPGRGGAS